MQPTNSNVEARCRTLTIIWAGLLASEFLFLIVLYFVRPGIYNFDFSKSFISENASVVVLALAFAGISTFLLSFLLKSKFIKQAIDKQNPGLVQAALVVGCALCESATLFGLILAFAFNYQYFFLWFALGIFGIILHFPRREDLIAASYRKP